ncbi:MAG: hypothetical protein PF569_07160 [Candidatus Woesearchaeota archaeon]|nr:hypothetical protein [Candidatus Woesearchaeota archaeon]
MDLDEIKKLNFVLSNSRGDFLNLGFSNNSTKYEGLCVLENKTLDVYKFLDEVLLEGVEVSSVEYGGYFVKRKFLSKVESLVIDETEDDEKVEEVVTFDKFYLGPSGGMIYEVSNYEGRINFDLDIRKLNDFDEWGRIYDVYVKDGVVLVEYKKEKEDSSYSAFFGIKAVNFSYDLVKDFVKKEYMYSKVRETDFERYVYRLMSVNVVGSKRMIIGAGFSESEVFEQISLLDIHEGELDKFDSVIFSDFISEREFEKPITQDFNVAYKLSNNAIYRFMNKDLVGNINLGSYAGFLWFSNIWARDELVGLRAFINNSEEKHVKGKLFDYLNAIDPETGMIRRINLDGSYQSPDACFWLAKRFEDFIFHLDKNLRLNDVLKKEELEIVFYKFLNSFHKLVENYWDKDNELLKVKFGDSWMDTIDVDFPLDIQVQFLSMVSFLIVLGTLIGKKSEVSELADFESLLKGKIRVTYFRSGVLYGEAYSDKIDSNVFLAYYFYPDLFLQSDWEQIFDNSLAHLWNSWGGVSTISKKDKRYKDDYTGENNLSYHLGDSWFWINNIAAIVMYDLNEKKFRPYISKIMMASTNDILKYGSIGFGSEISSSSKQKAEGNFSQMWSSSTYLEMIDKVFERKH